MWYPVGLAEPDHMAARGQSSMGPMRASCGSVPGLVCDSPSREAGGMPRTAHLAQPQQFWWLAIPEVCSPGEGTIGEVDKILWETKQVS